MDRQYVLDCFQLDDNAVFDQQVQLELGADTLAFVFEMDVPFALELKVLPPDFKDQAFSVQGLQQSWSEGSVHFNGAANDLLGQLVEF